MWSKYSIDRTWEEYKYDTHVASDSVYGIYVAIIYKTWCYREL